MNLNAFRVFLTVYERRSMTEAAADLHLTQSGVSQHIKALEDDLGFPLFERVGRTLLPTPDATEIFERGRKGFSEVVAALSGARANSPTIKGTVRIGLPVEFGNNLVIPELAKLGQKYPDLNFAITLDFATVLSPMVMKGELHMAMIDGFRVDPALRIEAIAEESFVLCGLKSYVKKFGPHKHSTAYYSKLDYVDYREGEPIIRNWFRHHLRRQNIDLNVRARVFDVQGVAKFILSGLGVGVLPDHVVNKLIAQGHELTAFEENRRPLKNEICLIQLPVRNRTEAERVVIDCLRQLKPAGKR